MKIKDFMITDVICVGKETTIKQLLETLVKNEIGGVPVVDEENRLIGMISDGDVIRYLQPRGRTVYDMFALVLVSEKEDLRQKIDYSINFTVEKIMRKKDLHMVDPEEGIEKALDIFSRFHFKKIPVADKKSGLIGVISRGDIIRYITTEIIANSNT